MKRFRSSWLVSGGVVILTLLLLAAVFFVIDYEKGWGKVETESSEEEVVEVEEEIEPAEPEIRAVSFQDVVESWASSVTGNKSILIYDLERGERVGEYNTKEDYIMESLYKLFVVYEGYKRIENGAWNKDMAVNSHGQTLEYCLDSAVRDSNSSCAEPIWSLIGHAELDQIAHSEWGISAATNISAITSNVEDILIIMKRFYEHPDFNNETLVARMKDSFLNQPPSMGLCGGPCEWRQGLPSGFSEKVNVYNKVGWRWGTNNWATYHDAAIVEFPEENRHFVVIVMTNYISYTDIAKLGTAIEEKFNTY
ncbi:hypothetical protein IJJ49_00330 [Candidatus Saccharibacteria bacterium]|nr:hypothetical protein [Candidatus Saccharibacteria bacterium]